MSDTPVSTQDVTENDNNGIKRQRSYHINKKQELEPQSLGLPGPANGPSIVGVDGWQNEQRSATECENRPKIPTEASKTSHNKCDRLKNGLEKSVRCVSVLGMITLMFCLNTIFYHI